MQFRDLQKQYDSLKTKIDLAISEVISFAHFIGGNEVSGLEKKLAEYVGVKHCITCANGTDAITIALKAWGIGSGDAVFVPDFTFFSSGECPATESALPVFVDVDEKTYNIDPEKLETEVKRIISEGKYEAKVVVAVDLFGQPADYKAIRKICDKYGLLLLEDGAQGFGGSLNEKMACSFGDISTTSFFPAKPLGCYGDGGAIFTNNDVWAEYMRSICVHGKDMNNPADPNAKYNNIRLGMNSRLDAIQAAILNVKLDAFVEHELNDVNSVAKWYAEELGDSAVSLPIVCEGCYSSWAQYTIRLPDKIDRGVVQNRLKEVGIPSNVYYAKPMHLQGAFAGTDSEKADCLVTERLCKSVLSLPIDPYKTREEIKEVATALKKIICDLSRRN